VSSETRMLLLTYVFTDSYTSLFAPDVRWCLVEREPAGRPTLCGDSFGKAVVTAELRSP